MCILVVRPLRGGGGKTPRTEKMHRLGGGGTLTLVVRLLKKTLCVSSLRQVGGVESSDVLGKGLATLVRFSA